MASKIANPIVRKSNAIARAKWSPESVWEARLVALLASKINFGDTDFQIYEISLSEIIGKNPGGKDYKEIENIVDKAMSRIITIRSDNDWKKYTLFSSCEFISKRGILKIGFHPDLKEHYLNLKQYVKFNLTEFMLLPSIYSQRLFEILKSWSDQSDVTLNLSDLHEMLEVPKALKGKYKDFRVRVLDKAYTDINTHTTLKYSWEPIKTGRAVTAIKFTFQKEVKQRPNKTLTKSSLPDPNVPVDNADAVAFAHFYQKFPNPGIISIRLRAWKMWIALHGSGNAPLADDVSDDNKLSVIDFLTQWQDEYLGSAQASISVHAT